MAIVEAKTNEEAVPGLESQQSVSPSSSLNGSTDLADSELAGETSWADQPSADAIDQLREVSVGSDVTTETDAAHDEEAALEEPAEAYEPPSFIERYGHMLGDAEEGCEPPEAPAPVRTVVAEEPSLDDESDDAALAAYMANMMNRMRGEPGTNEAAPSAAEVAPKPLVDPVGAVDVVADRVAAGGPIETEEKRS